MIPPLDIGPFCQAFFDNPCPAHAAMRDAAPVDYLPATASTPSRAMNKVRAMLLDWASFASVRGVGLADFAKETPWRLPSLLLEADPPLHNRARQADNKVLTPSAPCASPSPPPPTH